MTIGLRNQPSWVIPIRPPGTPAAFPSVLSTSGQNLVDANGYTMPLMKSFNIQPGSASAQDYLDIAAKGATHIVFAVFWDFLEPTQGNIDTVTYIPALDLDIARCQAAGMYCSFKLYFGSGIHKPTWLPDGTMASYVADGQLATQYLAKRYGDVADPLGAGKFTKAVIGFEINEPNTAISTSTASWITTLVSQQDQAAVWFRVYAPNWIMILAMGWAQTAPLPNAAGTGQSGQGFTGASATPITGGNFMVSVHDYFMAMNSNETTFDNRLGSGECAFSVGAGHTMIGVGDNTVSGGNNYETYPPTVSGGTLLTRTQCKAQMALWLQVYVDYCAAGYANCPLMIGEWGWYATINTTGPANYGADKEAIWVAAGAIIVSEWVYAHSQAGDPFAARPGVGATGADPDGWLTATNAWLAA